MGFLHVDPSTRQKLNQVNYHIKNGKPTFLLIYMEGCGPCNSTRPEWNKLQNSLFATNPEILITDIDQTLSNEVFKLPPPLGFPTMKFIQGSVVENYEDCPNIERKDRSVESFIQWIHSKIPKTTKLTKHKKKPAKKSTKKHKTKGGRRRRKYKSKTT